MINAQKTVICEIERECPDLLNNEESNKKED
jgi:hypothetical protein